MALPQTERRPLWVPFGEQRPDGTWVDGERILRPDDPSYEDAYRVALHWHERAGEPMPWADAQPVSGVREVAGAVLPWSPRAAGGAVRLTPAGVREAGAGHWVTIEDDEGLTTHIFVGHGGLVTKGPKHLIGANIKHLPSSPGRYQTTHHAEGHTPSGHDSHPHYREHQDKKRVYGKHGPGIGYEVDNPLRELSEEETHKGRDEAFKTLRAHLAPQHAGHEAAVAAAKRAAGLDPDRDHLTQVRERFHAERDRSVRKANPKIKKGAARWEKESAKDEHIVPSWAAAHDSVAQHLETAHKGLAPDVQGSLSGRRLAEDARWHRDVAQRYRGGGNEEVPEDPEGDRAIAERLRPHLLAEVGAASAPLHKALSAAETPQAMVLALVQHIGAIDPAMRDASNTAKAERIKRLVGDATQRGELTRSDHDFAYFAAHALHQHSFGTLPTPADLPSFNKDVAQTLRYSLADDRRRGLSSRVAHEHAQRGFERGLADVRAGRRSPDPQIKAGTAPVDQSRHYKPGTAQDILDWANKRAQEQFGQTQEGARDAMAALPAHMRHLLAAAGTTTHAHGNYASDSGIEDASQDASGEYMPHLRHERPNSVHVYRSGRDNARTVAAHEYAHAHDEALGRARNGAKAVDRFGIIHNPTHGHWRSEEPDFRALYRKYNNDERLPDYMRTNPHEFYAEGLAWHHGHSNYDLPQEKLREVAPEVADKFDQIMRESKEASRGQHA